MNRNKITIFSKLLFFQKYTKNKSCHIPNQMISLRYRHIVAVSALMNNVNCTLAYLLSPSSIHEPHEPNLHKIISSYR
jgi:hypothetical protein